MKSLTKLLAVLALLVPFVASRAQVPEEMPLETGRPGFSAGINNKYSSRFLAFGMPFSEGPVWQPTLWSAYGDFSEKGDLVKGVSASAMPNKNFKKQGWDEVDLDINYTCPVGENSSLTLGTTYFPSDIDGAWRSLGTAYTGFSAGDLSLTLHRIYGFMEGNYAELGLSKEYELGDNAGISTSTSLAYNDKAFRENSGFSHFHSNITASANLTDKVAVSASVDWTNPLADDIEGAFSFTTNMSYGLK